MQPSVDSSLFCAEEDLFIYLFIFYFCLNLQIFLCNILVITLTSFTCTRTRSERRVFRWHSMMHEADERYECTGGKEFQISSPGLCDLVGKSV